MGDRPFRARTARPARALRRWTLSILAAVLLTTPLGAAAATPRATVTAGTNMGLPGSAGVPVTVSIRSQYGAEVVGLNFDLTYDASRLSVADVTLGAAAEAAGKTIAWSPAAANRVHVLVVGINQTAIADGAVAVVTFNVLAGARRGASPLSLTGIVVSDPDSEPITSRGVHGAFRVVSRLR